MNAFFKFNLMINKSFSLILEESVMIQRQQMKQRLVKQRPISLQRVRNPPTGN